MRVFISSILLLFVGLLYAEENKFTIIEPNPKFGIEYIIPNQKIIGAEQPFAPGEVILLKVSPISDPSPKYLTDIIYTWRVIVDGKPKENVVIWPDGSQIFFGAGVSKAKINVLMIAHYLYVVKDDKGQITSVAHKSSQVNIVEVIVGGPEPGPLPPNPNPPNPNPPSPDPIFPAEISNKVYQWTKERVFLPQNEKVRTAKALANSFSSIASAISAGTIKDTKQILEETKRSNNYALGNNTIEWELWGTELQEYIYKLYESGKLNTSEDFRKLWLDIAVGLNGVK